MNNSRGGLLSGFPLSGSAPIPPTAHCRSETQLQNRSGELNSKNVGADSTSDRAVTTTEQRGDPSQYPVHALVTTTSVGICHYTFVETIDCTTPRENLSLNYRIWKIIMSV